jgi:uncharacterized protein (TIGR00725 family)
MASVSLVDRSILLLISDSGKQPDYALRYKMARRPVIAIIGSGSDLEPAISNAFALGRLIAENGWILITGGRDAGVMKAANQGAKEVGNSLTVGILPNSGADVSPYVDVAIVTHTGQARNNIIVLSADVVVACGVEGAGTASEVALALKNGKSVILLGPTRIAEDFFRGIGGERIVSAPSPAEAIQLLTALLNARPDI